jgi:hypothetical protein
MLRNVIVMSLFIRRLGAAHIDIFMRFVRSCGMNVVDADRNTQDGHSAGALDTVWARMFGAKVHYIKHLMRAPPDPAPSSVAGGGPPPQPGQPGWPTPPPPGGKRRRHVCFALAYTVAPGYNSVLSVGNMDQRTDGCTGAISGEELRGGEGGGGGGSL